MAKSTRYWHERIEEILRSTFYSPRPLTMYYVSAVQAQPAITNDTLEDEMGRRRIPKKHRAYFVERYRQVQREVIAARVATRLRGEQPHFKPVVTHSTIQEFGMYGSKRAGKTQFLRTFLDTNGAGKVVARIVNEDGSPIEEGADLPPGNYHFEVVLDEVADDPQ